MNIKNENIIASNKNIFFNYDIEQYINSGVVLKGWEVKSIRKKKIQLVNSYVQIREDEAWLFNAVITPIALSKVDDTVEQTKKRKLLLNRKEINRLMHKISQKGYALVPFSIYWEKNFIKVKIALAIGKKTHDKRKIEKEKTWQQEKLFVFKLKK